MADQITVATKRYIRKNPALIDNFFEADPLLPHLKQVVKEDFSGGRLIQENLVYRNLITQYYAKGAEFDITERQIEDGLQWTPKFAMANVTMSKEDIQVFNKGPEAAFRLIDSRMTVAYQSIGAGVAISLYLNGIRAGFTNLINGLAEALNDNSTVSWDNNTYANYGGLARGGTYGRALDSVPTNINGALTYNNLEETYATATFGNIEPTIGMTTVLGYSFIKEHFQTQQRFNDTQNPAIGFTGLKFNSATIYKSRYVPGSNIAQTSPQTDSNRLAVDFLTLTSDGAVTAYPTLAVASSETLFWLNCRHPYIALYISNDEEYGFGFTGFKPAQGNTKIAGQVLAALALTVSGPRYHKQVHGFTS